MAKRIYLRNLKKLEGERSLVRELEMSVDAAINQQGYIIQFWRDAELYGIDEAILYVKNGGYGNWQAIDTKWQQIKSQL